MEKILIQSDTPVLGDVTQEANLWRFHFARKFFVDAHGSLFIGSKEAATLGGQFFVTSLDCDGIMENDPFIKRYGPDDLGARVKLLQQKTMELNTAVKTRPALLFCKNGTGVSAAFAIAYILFINVYKFIADQSTPIIPVNVAINRIRSTCADLYSVLPVLDMEARIDLESGRKVHVGFRQVLDPTIPDHRLWLKVCYNSPCSSFSSSLHRLVLIISPEFSILPQAIHVWYTSFTRTVVPKHLQASLTRQLLGIPDVVKHHYCHYPERLRMGGGVQDDLTVVENKLGRSGATEQAETDTFVEEFDDDDDTIQPRASLDLDLEASEPKAKNVSDLQIEGDEGELEHRLNHGLGDDDWDDEGFDHNDEAGDMNGGDDLGLDRNAMLGAMDGADAFDMSANIGFGDENSIINDITGAFTAQREGDEVVQLGMAGTGFDFDNEAIGASDFMGEMPLPGEFDIDAPMMNFDSPMHPSHNDLDDEFS